MTQKLRILYETPDLIAVDKPAGFQVHPQENRVSSHINRSKICLYVLRDQIGRKVYPIHRLDQPTSGVVLFGKTSSETSKVSQVFANRRVKKTYLAVCRGWTEDHVTISSPLKNESLVEQEAKTTLSTLARISLPFKTNSFETSRYSLVRAYPHTGRFHQIRRHLKRIGHPIIGDTKRGDTKHNHYFKNELKISGLCLMAYELEFVHPNSKKHLKIKSIFRSQWHQIFDLFQVCPWNNPEIKIL